VNNKEWLIIQQVLQVSTLETNQLLAKTLRIMLYLDKKTKLQSYSHLVFNILNLLIEVQVLEDIIHLEVLMPFIRRFKMLQALHILSLQIKNKKLIAINGNKTKWHLIQVSIMCINHLIKVVNLLELVIKNKDRNHLVLNQLKL